jgi:RNA polymerase sigma factor (sigma-70 family)
MAIGGLWRQQGWGARRSKLPVLLAALLAKDDGSPVAVSPQMQQDGMSTEPAEFEAFFHAHERAVYACLWRLTGDPQTARDLTQETFLRAWRHFERVRTHDQPHAWLLRVATNLALTARRRDHPNQLSTDALNDDAIPTRADPMRDLAERDQVERALLALPPQQRAALTLREVYGFSCAEIGAALGISRDAVKMALYRGREGFRRHYLRQEATVER